MTHKKASNLPENYNIEIIDWEKVDAIICDFDGVLTDNQVYTSQDGEEMVNCSRADGLAFDVLRKIGLKAYIFSTESNPVVKARANKLKIPVIQSVKNKDKSLVQFANENEFDLHHILYIGNDLNDYLAMNLCGYRACPSDAHPKIQSICNVHLRVEGGKGVVRDIVERIFKIDIISKLYQDNK